MGGIKYALILAQKLDSKIYVFHAYNVPHAGRNVMIDIIDVLIKDAKEDIEKLKERLTNEGIDISKMEFLCERGVVKEVAARLCRLHQIDLVIMGVKGSTNILEKVIGSVTSGVITSLEKPILVLPSFIDVKLPESLLLTIDQLNENIVDTISPLVELAQLNNVEVNVLSVGDDCVKQSEEFLNHETGIALEKLLVGVKHAYHFQKVEV